VIFVVAMCGIHAKPHIPYMASIPTVPISNFVPMAVDSADTINWCHFVPLRGFAPPRHEALEGADYCLKHQRLMSARQTRELIKQVEDDRKRRIKIMDEKTHSLSVLEAQRRRNKALDTEEQELERRIQEKSTRPARPNSMKSSQQSTATPPQQPSKSSASSSRSKRSTAYPPAPEMLAIINSSVAEILRQYGIQTASQPLPPRSSRPSRVSSPIPPSSSSHSRRSSHVSSSIPLISSLRSSHSSVASRASPPSSFHSSPRFIDFVDPILTSDEEDDGSQDLGSENDEDYASGDDEVSDGDLEDVTLLFQKARI